MCSHHCNIEGKDMILPSYCPMDGKATVWSRVIK